MGRTLLLAAALLAALAAGARAEDLRGLARLDTAASSIADARRGVAVSLTLSQPVPWRAVLLAGEVPRLALEFSELALDGIAPRALDDAVRVLDVRAERSAPGWSRLILTLDRPYVLSTAELRRDETTGAGRLEVRLRAASQDEYDAEAREDTARTLPPVPRGRQQGDRPLLVVLDPGHGGFDPGARNGAYSEAVLMLTFARELQEKLVRSGGYDVILTRNGDTFVSLPERVAIARRAGADLFLSLHADAVEVGRARGASVYTLSDEASDEASALLASRLDRADLLAGVDLGAADDTVARALMDLGRLETRPRSERLGDHLVANLDRAVGGMHKRPRMAAAFSVLRAPDIPSALVEMGFITSDSDLKNLLDPAWRDRAAEGIRAALDLWAMEDAAEAELVRQ
jgi:N-acetylmuramoyl-L-alanine amidase